jgi:phage gpG-like protein
MIEFTYSLSSTSIDRALGALLDAAADRGEAIEEIAADFREMAARQFATEGSAEGTPWPPLAPSTARRKKAGAGLLVSSGMLARSLGVRGAAGSVEEQDAHSLALGTRIPYAAFHRFGTSRMPARPLIVLSAARAAKWTEIVRRGIERRTSLLSPQDLGGRSA